MKKNKQKINWSFCLKSFLVIFVFIITSMVLLYGSGITDRLSNCFYVEQYGEVAGEYSVRMAATQVNTLAINQNNFTINGQTSFLLGASVFDAINWDETKMVSDLDYLAQNNYNLIRVWADWQWQDGTQNSSRNSTVYDTTKKDGSLDTIKIEKLKRIIDAAKTRGIIVDLVITDFNPSYYVDGESLQSLLSKHQKAATNITTALQGKPNLFFDLMNEHDNNGSSSYLPFPSHDDIKKIAEAVRAADGSRYITVSNRGNTSMVQTQIVDELSKTNNPFYTPHFSRTSDWWSSTGERIGAVKTILNNMSPVRNIPIYLQEEQNFGDDPTQSHFVEAAKQAKNNNAAGWVFHQTAGFDLKNSKSFKDQLGDNGRATLEAIGAAVGTPGGPTGDCNIKTDVNFWSVSNGNDFKEIPICNSSQAGYVEFEVSGISLDNMPLKTGYSVFTILDKSGVNNPYETSQNPNYITLKILGQGYGGEYPGMIHYRSNINNTCDYMQCHHENDGVKGSRCSDDTDSPSDQCPPAWEWYGDFPYEPWENKTHKFRIEWGAGSNNKHLIYKYWSNGTWQTLKDWDPGQITNAKYQNFGWLADNMVLRLGNSTMYPGIKGSIYKNITVKTTSPGTTPKKCVADLAGKICQPNQTCSTGNFATASDTNYCCVGGTCQGGCSAGYSYCKLGKMCASDRWYYNTPTTECCATNCMTMPRISNFPVQLPPYLNTDKSKYDLNIGTADNQVDLFINYNTTLQNNALAPLSQILITPASPVPSAPTNEKVIKAYNFGLGGAQFDPPIKLAFNYTNAEMTGIVESSLYIGLWDSGNNKWIKQTTSLDQANNKAEAQISHFSIYGLLGGLLCGNGTCDTGENSINCPADCPPTPQINCGNGICEGGETNANCPADCPTGGGSADLIKIDDNARNPAVVVDSMGNLHVAYDCVSAGGVCYRKIYQEMGQIKKGPVIPLASGTNDPRVGITDGDQIHIVTAVKYIVIEPDGTIIKKDLPALNSPRLALSTKNPGEAYVLYRETDRYGAIKMKKIKASGGTISEEATITVNDKCSKPQMPGNVVVDKDDVVHLTWRQFGDSDSICPGRNVQYIQYKNNSFVNKKEIFGATSDYTDMELNEATGEFHMIATTPQGTCGLAYRTMDMGGNLSPIYYLYLPYGITYACTKPAGETASYIISGAADRRGEANITAPYMSFENDGKLHIAFIGAGTQIRPDTIEDALKNVYWEVDNIDPNSMPVPNSSDLEQLKARWLSQNSGKTTNDYIEMLNEEIFCWNNPASYLSAKGCYYYTAYHTVLDKATLKSDTPPGGDAPNNIPTPEKFTPERTKESDQGSDASNPIIDKAWNQGVFMVFEDDYENPKFNIYLKAVGGAVIGIPQMKADLNCSGKVDVVDLGILMSCWGNNYDQYSPQSCALGANIKAACKRPINIDGLTGSDGKETIDISDFSIMMGCWGVNNSPQCFAVIGP
ncbi:glycoside hydrolase family 5 protein [Candidatus Kuenenbacteria bacterium]|nr:glycoside hydrolase family 5 protein [Candidatus Kuenenbacteria bacterium]